MHVREGVKHNIHIKPKSYKVKLLGELVINIYLPTKAYDCYCYSIVELETSWENETCIHLELGIVLHINRFSSSYLWLHGIKAILMVVTLKNQSFELYTFEL